MGDRPADHAGGLHCLRHSVHPRGHVQAPYTPKLLSHVKFFRLRTGSRRWRVHTVTAAFCSLQAARGQWVQPAIRGRLAKHKRWREEPMDIKVGRAAIREATEK